MAAKAAKHSLAEHNRIVRRGYRRADLLEPRLAAVLKPILDQAGSRAAAAFTQHVTDHMTAALVGAADITPRSTMVAVYPRPEEAAAVAEDGGEEPGIMHVTLAYLGDVDAETAALVAEAVASVASAHPPLEGTVGGVGAFDDNGNGVPAILLPDVPGLVELRQAVCAAIVEAGADYARNHGYTPHVTVAYREGEEDHPPDRGALGLPLHFDSVRVVQGDETLAEHRLTGSHAVTAAAGPTPWTPPPPNHLVDVPALVALIRKKTGPVREAFLAAVMAPTLKAAGIAFDVSSPFAGKVLAQSASQIVHIAETTQANVMRIIAAAHENGLSIPETARAIRAGMREASGSRATLIARTELAGVSNGGSLAATQMIASELGIGYSKSWLTADGAKYPRHEDYEGLDGQTVALDEAFDVGGNALQFPGDPDGDVEDVANCRCTLVYVEADSGGASIDSG